MSQWYTCMSSWRWSSSALSRRRIAGTSWWRARDFRSLGSATTSTSCVHKRPSFQTPRKREEQKPHRNRGAGPQETRDARGHKAAARTSKDTPLPLNSGSHLSLSFPRCKKNPLVLRFNIKELLRDAGSSETPGFPAFCVGFPLMRRGTQVKHKQTRSHTQCQGFRRYVCVCVCVYA